MLLKEPVGAGEEAGCRVERTTESGEPMPLDLLGIVLETGELRTLS